MNRFTILIVAAFLIIIALMSSIFIVDEREKALVLQFGQIKRVEEDPGLSFKVPLIQEVVRYDDRILSLDTAAIEVTPSDDRRLVVDAFARYRIFGCGAVSSGGRTRWDSTGRRSRLDSHSDQRNPRRAWFGRCDVEYDPVARACLFDEPYPHECGCRGGLAWAGRCRRAAKTAPTCRNRTWRRRSDRMRAEREREAADERARGERSRTTGSGVGGPDPWSSLCRMQAARPRSARGEADAQRNAIFADAFGADPEFFEFYRSLSGLSGRFGCEQLDAWSSRPTGEFFELPQIRQSDRAHI